MASGGPKPQNMTRYREMAFQQIVHQRDPGFALAANLVPEYEFPQKKGPDRVFTGYYKKRGPYRDEE